MSNFDGQLPPQIAVSGVVSALCSQLSMAHLSTVRELIGGKRCFWSKFFPLKILVPSLKLTETNSKKSQKKIGQKSQTRKGFFSPIKNFGMKVSSQTATHSLEGSEHGVFVSWNSRSASLVLIPMHFQVRKGGDL